jgi:hypothetical protein
MGWAPGEIPGGALGGGDDGSGIISPGLVDVPGIQPMPTVEDMNATNASNAAARAKAIEEGMDEGTAAIVYPDFSEPDDMLRIN